MSYFYIGVREQRVRDLKDQLPDDQHRLDRYAEIGDKYNMSESNAKTFKTLNAKTCTNSINAIETYKGKSEPCLYCVFSHIFGQCPDKEAKYKILFKKWSLYLSLDSW